uniref:Uncharacterized protein n=1 Tax=Cacopsylla melanoneura TaxID=428564 RepID=A0A8D8UQS8_9HEMI
MADRSPAPPYGTGFPAPVAAWFGFFWLALLSSMILLCICRDSNPDFLVTNPPSCHQATEVGYVQDIGGVCLSGVNQRQPLINLEVFFIIINVLHENLDLL